MSAASIALLCASVLTALAVLPQGGSLPPADQLPAHPELPDPLTTFAGGTISDADAWRDVCRPELKRLFQHYMYGELPKPARIRWTLEREDKQALSGKATKREVAIEYGPAGTPPIHLMLVLPNNRKGRVPVFLGIAFCGNAAILDDPSIPLPQGWQYPGNPGIVDHKATEAVRGSMVKTWNVELAIDRGYGVATFYNGDVMPDVNDWSQGAWKHLVGRTTRRPDDCGTIALWAYGMQRAIDYLITDRDVDPKRIGAVGHSRNGKASIVAAAFDERIAMVIPLQAGCGGTAPSRGTVGESVTRINTSFPHWFCGHFKEFNDRPERLPFDQHELVALCAPRPVLFSNAVEDEWANPAGQFDVLKAADPVYRLLGVDGLGTSQMPATGKLLNSRLGYFIRPGKHSMATIDWQAFLDFADKHLRKQAP